MAHIVKQGAKQEQSNNYNKNNKTKNITMIVLKSTRTQIKSAKEITLN